MRLIPSACSTTPTWIASSAPSLLAACAWCCWRLAPPLTLAAAGCLRLALPLAACRWRNPRCCTVAAGRLAAAPPCMRTNGENNGGHPNIWVAVSYIRHLSEGELRHLLVLKSADVWRHLATVNLSPVSFAGEDKCPRYPQEIPRAVSLCCSREPTARPAAPSCASGDYSCSVRR